MGSGNRGVEVERIRLGSTFAGESLIAVELRAGKRLAKLLAQTGPSRAVVLTENKSNLPRSLQIPVS